MQLKRKREIVYTRSSIQVGGGGGGRTLCVVLRAKKIVTPGLLQHDRHDSYTTRKLILFCFLTIPKTWRQLITELRVSALVAYRYIFTRLTSPISHPWYATVTIYETIRIPQATDTEHQEMFLYAPNFFTTSKFWTKPYYTLHLPLHGKNKNSSILYIQISRAEEELLENINITCVWQTTTR